MANRNKNVMRKNEKGKKPYNSKKGKWNYQRDNDTNCSEISGPNDLNWYVVDEQILNDAARIPYSIPVGMPFKRDGKFTPSSLTLASYDDALPGLMVSWVVPNLGNASNAGDAVNVAANGVYQFVRSKISGSRPYDAVDMMVYLGAMDSIFCYVTWLTRLYATVFTYHQANRYLSRALIESQGVDYDDLVANLSQFRAAINTKIAKIRALYLPAILPIFKRHSWLFSTYYIEGESEKDQIYFHAPAGIYHFKYDSDQAGMLECYNIIDSYGQLNTSAMLNILDTLINPIYADEDFNRISGDFLKAYEGGVFTISEIPDIATISLTHSEEVLLQFKNAKYKYVIPHGDRITFFNYTQDANKTYLKMNASPNDLKVYFEVDGVNNTPVIVDSSASAGQQIVGAGMMYDWSKDTMLTSPRKDVTPGENMINTRLTLAFDITGDPSAIGQANFTGMYFGSEWPVEYRIYTYHRSKSTGITSMFYRRYDSHLELGIDNNDMGACKTWILSQHPIRSAFKYLPELTLIYAGRDDSGNIEWIDPGRSIFEVDNYCLVNQNVISGLHNAAILGEYNIPKLAISK